MTIKSLLERLMKDKETEIKEFKEAKNGFDFKTLGKYFSALSNEANLKGVLEAWLVFGITDKRNVVGTTFRGSKEKLDSLKKEIADNTTNRITFDAIYESDYLGKRVLLFKIPAAPRGFPVAFKGHYYGREGESISPLNLQEIERIRATHSYDWSAEIVKEATLEDLDPKAILQARINFRKKFPQHDSDIDIWDDMTFLNKAKVLIKGKITRTALLLLGKSESDVFLNPSVARIRWILKGEDNSDKDYEQFSPPFLLAVDRVYSKIRNLKYRYIREETLFPEEVQRYEPFVIREALNNCIAHQDYLKAGMINVIELGDDQLVFSNYGDFIPKSVEKVVIENSPEEFYRNRFLVTAMFNLNMVDTVGSGIRTMFDYQKQRFFPLPDYNFEHSKVTVTITGKVLNLDFARALSRNKNLKLEEILILDKVQKNKPISADEAKFLKSKGLIEGRKPKYYISSKVIEATHDSALKAQYIKQRGFDDEYYKKLILECISKYKSATKNDLDALLIEKFSDVLSLKQKKNKLSNLLGILRRNGVIFNKGTTNKPVYVFFKNR